MHDHRNACEWKKLLGNIRLHSGAVTARSNYYIFLFAQIQLIKIKKEGIF